MVEGAMTGPPTGTETETARTLRAATAPRHPRRTAPESGARVRRPSQASGHRRAGIAYSHSMVPGGLLVTSTATRLIARTSLVIRVEIVSMTSYGNRAQSAVMASSDVTGRSTTG